jgi:hypothetical protein
MLGFFKPAEGCTVDQEDGTPWPEEGMDAPNTLFNRRRIACGDLIEADRPAEPSPEEPKEIDPPAGGENPQTETPKRTRRPTGDK